MSEIHPELIEKYQLMLEKDPKAKIFAPLSEAYRKMGLKKEALSICQNGVQHNPHFAGGRVALAKILIEEQDLEGAAEELQKATELSPENILAQSLLADTALKLRRPKEALKAYKMVLLLNPHNEKAQKAVNKLESLTADEFDEELFAMKPLTQAFSAPQKPLRGQASGASASVEGEAPHLRPLGLEEMERKERRDLERLLSLADAYVVRNDMDKALEALQEIQRLYGSRPEVKKRLQLIDRRQDREVEDIVVPVEAPLLNRQESWRKKQVEYLQRVLRRLQNMS